MGRFDHTLRLSHESVPALLGDWRHRIGSDGADGPRPPWAWPRWREAGGPWEGGARAPGRAGRAAPPRGQRARHGDGLVVEPDIAAAHLQRARRLWNDRVAAPPRAGGAAGVRRGVGGWRAVRAGHRGPGLELPDAVCFGSRTHTRKLHPG